MSNIDAEQLPPMTDSSGDRLDPEEALLVSQYGFQGGGHYEKYRNWAVRNWARQTGENPTDCEFRMGTIARDRLRAERAGAMAAPGGALSPVEGVSCAQWAALQAQLAGGADANAVIASSGMDAAKWSRVSAEWNQRMSTDTTGTVASAYANAFAGGGVGPYGGAAAQAASAGVAGDIGAEPVPFELFVEVTEALRAGDKRGVDGMTVLASFNLRPVDWSNIGMYWNRKIAQQATKYHALYSELGVKYAAKYGNGDGLTNDQREEMIIGKILTMTKSGQVSHVLPFLREYFPDLANDSDALDWWLDKACDLCPRTGDRATAQQLLIVRHGLRQESDPVQQWVPSELERLF
jgi:hypothetical protein